MSDSPPMIPLPAVPTYSDQERIERSRDYYTYLRQRRTVRDFASTAIPQAVIEQCLLAAGSAPSGANLQPWHFVVVTDPRIKTEIRRAAEAEEREFYESRAPRDWLDALAPLGTDSQKPFLEIAPYLIAIFRKPHDVLPDGTIRKHYYSMESVGIATGLLISALHHAGLVTLTHTPSPMNFLNQILGRPSYERPFLLLVAGLPAAGARVPDIHKKSLEQIATFL